MNSLEPILGHVVPFVLVLSRLVGLLAAAPAVSGSSIPMKARALLAAALAAALYPVTPRHIQETQAIDFTVMLPMLLGEVLVGAAMGMIAALPLLAMDMSGVFSGQMMGLGLGRVYNPDADGDFDVLGHMLYLIAGSTFVAVGGVEWLFLSLARTFEHIPAGGIALSQAPLEIFLAVVRSGFELAIRVSLPVLGIVALLVVAIGAVGKTMPQINVMNIGFTLKSGFGLLVLALSLAAVGAATADEIRDVLGAVARWATGQ